MLALFPCPCEHNSWDNVRTRRGVSTLRCRVCDALYKLKQEALSEKCMLFNKDENSCSGCGKLHVHSSKLSLATRVALFGEGVLGNVPAMDHPIEQPCSSVSADESCNSSEEVETDTCSEDTHSACPTPKAAHLHPQSVIYVNDDGSVEFLTEPASLSASYDNFPSNC